MVQRVYSKCCKWCGQLAIFWNESKQYFSDGPNSDSPKHACAGSSMKHRQEDQDKKLNEKLNSIINDLKSQTSSLFSDQVQRIDSLQKSTARNTSLLVEIKVKLDGLLRA